MITFICSRELDLLFDLDVLCISNMMLLKYVNYLILNNSSLKAILEYDSIVTTVIESFRFLMTKLNRSGKRWYILVKIGVPRDSNGRSKVMHISWAIWFKYGIGVPYIAKKHNIYCEKD